jgi:hypothetical protein
VTLNVEDIAVVPFKPGDHHNFRVAECIYGPLRALDDGLADRERVSTVAKAISPQEERDPAPGMRIPLVIPGQFLHAHRMAVTPSEQ